MSVCKWFYNGGEFESETHTYIGGICRLCGQKDPDYKPRVGNCLYCGRSVKGSSICGKCQETLDNEATLFSQGRI